TPSRSKTDDNRANDKSRDQDQRQRNEHTGYRNPGVQQIDDKERRTTVQRDRVNPIMEIEKVDSAVAKERHKKTILGLKSSTELLRSDHRHCAASINPNRPCQATFLVQLKLERADD